MRLIFAFLLLLTTVFIADAQAGINGCPKGDKAVPYCIPDPLGVNDVVEGVVCKVKTVSVVANSIDDCRAIDGIPTHAVVTRHEEIKGSKSENQK